MSSETSKPGPDREVRDDARRYQFALETAGIGLWEYDVETGQSIWDDVTKACFGVDVEGKVPLDAGFSLIHPDDREQANRSLERVLDPASSGEYSAEKRIIRPDGQTRWIRTTGRAIFEGEGDQRRATRVIGTVRDITKEKRAGRAEQYLSEAGVRFAKTLDYSETLRDVATVAKQFFADHCVISLVEQDGFDPHRELGTVGEASEQITGVLERHGYFDPEQTELEAVRNRESVLIEDPESELLEPLNAEFTAAADSEARWASSLIAVPLESRGQFLGYIWFLCTTNDDTYDEDDLVLAEQLAVRAALAADNARLYTMAQRAIRTRDELQAAIVHDLRNPLTILRGMEGVLEIKMVEGTADEACLQRHVRVQKRAIEQMDHLIKNLYTVASLDAGTFRIDPHPVDPAVLVDEALDLAWLRGKQKDLEVDSTIEAGLPNVCADRRALSRVAANLVHNAVKFTPEGGRIHLSARDDDGFVRFEVADSGPGVPDEMVPQIFERYWQATSGAQQGTGLGLSIAYDIVQAHGGDMWVDSEPGEGATFGFTIPVVSED
jgi:PAS domain S-box-containing protein